MAQFGIIALISSSFPEALSEPTIAVAAARAGATGAIDLEYAGDDVDIQHVVDTISSAGSYGIRCGVKRCLSLFDRLHLPAGGTMILYDDQAADEDFCLALGLVRDSGLNCLVEATCEKLGNRAQELGADGIVAKGNEGGGFVGEETSFVLLQRLISAVTIPVWVQGGIGVNTAAACFAAGARGVVLDSQLLLTDESPVAPEIQSRILKMDGSETILWQGPDSGLFRCFARSQGSEGLRPEPWGVKAEAGGPAQALWLKAVRERVLDGLSQVNPLDRLLVVGQDIALAATLAKRYGNVASILRAIERQVDDNRCTALEKAPLAAGAPLAVAHGTTYPILQGAMTRVSDNAPFARAVAEGGALPFLALALMRAEEIDHLLAETKAALDGKPWGVGILGFVPERLRHEQQEVILKHKPPFVLIAGGRPDQAKAYDRAGIPAYLHVPSPYLLRSFIEDGSRRFIFEGRECGGHVGPRSSFVLWETMISVLLEAADNGLRGEEFHVVFAGGIHDRLSAAMVATLSAPLVERGMRVGVLLGTAYLFTEEAVATGAIVSGFQQRALACQGTVLLESGPGHAIRCIDSPYRRVFELKRKELEAGKKGREAVREELELMNLGRLRIASKALVRQRGGQGNAGKLVRASEDQQWSEGMYMIGQVAALRSRTGTIAELHREISEESTKYLHSLSAPDTVSPPKLQSGASQRMLDDVAIVGMACLFPMANDVERFWLNILNKVDAITEIPAQHFKWENFYDANPLARDKISSKWGGFLGDVPFEPARYGIPPSSLSSIDPMQILLLETARKALKDAGYDRRAFPRARTSVLLANAGHGPITAFYSLRSMLGWVLADLDERSKKILEDRLPEWTEDSFPGYLGNVTAGRVANRMDLGGINFSIDAACASSLAALYVAMSELRCRSSDVVLLAATDTHNQPGDYLSFSKTHALSPSGRCHTFDQAADGIVISEGIAVLVLKRLADAERDGDKIYAVVKGIGGSSDGRDLSLTAPRPAGQMLALNRAYENAGLPPSTLTLIEAHGTGTVAGDKAEIEALRQIFEGAQSRPRACAVGSVKTNIGHTKCAAGLASLIKVAKALHHKVLPPTIGVKTPNPACRFEDSPFYINSQARPWLHAGRPHPRRAGVSAFGFGGTNFHAVVEEYSNARSLPGEALAAAWPAELFIFQGASTEALARTIQSTLDTTGKLRAASSAECTLADLAYSHYLKSLEMPGGEVALSLVATSISDLIDKLERALAALKDTPAEQIRDPRGIYFSQTPLGKKGKVAFLFPGQGSQHLNMLLDLALHFEPVRKAYEEADQVLESLLPQVLSTYIFPPPAFTEEERSGQMQELTNTRIAQAAVGAACLAAYDLIGKFAVKPDMVAGHSYGEYVALCAAGALSRADLLRLSEERGRILSAANGGAMAATSAGPEDLAGLGERLEGVRVANFNAPDQSILAGSPEKIETAIELLREKGWQARRIAVSAAFHSPAMQPVKAVLDQCLQNVDFTCPVLPVYSNSSGSKLAVKAGQLAGYLGEHLVSPVRFVDEISKMYADGARVFIEVGPSAVLTSMVGSILGKREHLVVSFDRPGRNGLVQLLHLLAQLASEGVRIYQSPLYSGRFRGIGKCGGIAGMGGLTANADKKRKPSLIYRVSSAAIWREGEQPPSSTPAGKDTLSFQTAMSQATGAPAPSSRSNHSLPDGKKISFLNHDNDRQMRHELQAHTGTERTGTEIGVDELVKVQQSLGPDTELDDVARVVMHYQKTMLDMTSNFLEAQQRVMLAYLEARKEGDAGAVARMIKHSSEQALNPAPKPGTRDGKAPDVVLDCRPLQDGDKEKLDSQAEPSCAQRGEDDPEALIQALLDIVSQRTGYPPEMLDPNLDLEADLGIDSIKRVEILSTFRKLLPESKVKQLEGGIEALAGTKTLQGIIDWIRSMPDAAPLAPESPAPAAFVKVEPLSANSQMKRGLIAVADHPITSRRAFESDRLILISGDELGAAPGLKQALAARGIRTFLLKHEVRQGFAKSGDMACVNLGDLTEVEALMADLRQQHGPIGGLVHLLPLTSSAAKAGAEEHCLALRALFHLARTLDADLRANGTILTTTALGGDFAVRSGARLTLSDAVDAGVVGLAKTIAREWPGATVRALDFEPGLEADEIWRIVLAELDAEDNQVEIGYESGKRQSLVVADGTLAEAGAMPALDLNPQSVVLVTGGARGVTAEVCLELAERFRPTMIIVGRSPRPDGEESPDTASLTGAREIKAAIMDRLRKGGQEVTIAAVESIYQKLIKQREVRTNLRRMERAGATVRYYSVDVSDQRAFAELIAHIYESFGRIDGVIHGAGIIQDALIKDKAPASFAHVVDTKVMSALALVRNLKLDALKFFYFFSSIVGRTGNAGQGDYVAANEILNKIALFLDSKCPGRVASLMWGPWQGGMAQPELQAVFARYNWAMIESVQGRQAFVRELLEAPKGQCEVMLVAELAKSDNAGGALSGPGASQAASLPVAAGARLRESTVYCPERGKTVFELNLSVELDKYLNDHKFDGIPVLPMAMAVELLVEAGSSLYRDLSVTAMEDLEIPAGLVIDSGSRQVRVIMVERERTEHGAVVEASIVSGKDSVRTHFKTLLHLASCPLEKSQSLQLPAIKQPELHVPSAVDVYKSWMFHGPLFQGIASIDTLGVNGVKGRVLASTPGQCLAHAAESSWLVDPVLLDSAMQLAGIWARHFMGITVLPTGVERITFYQIPQGTTFDAQVFIHNDRSDGELSCDLLLKAADGSAVLFMEGLRGVGSKSFNRLAAQPKELRAAR